MVVVVVVLLVVVESSHKTLCTASPAKIKHQNRPALVAGILLCGYRKIPLLRKDIRLFLSAFLGHVNTRTNDIKKEKDLQKLQFAAQTRQYYSF